MLLCCTTLSSSRENQPKCSRGSKKDFWRRCQGGLRKSQHTKYPSQPLSPALHYLPFASRYPLPHFTLAVLFSLSLSLSSLSFSICLFLPACFLFALCWTACLSRWLKITLNCVTLPIPTTMILLALRLLVTSQIFNFECYTLDHHCISYFILHFG